MQRMHLALQRSAPLSEEGKRRGTRTCEVQAEGKLMTAGKTDEAFIRELHQHQRALKSKITKFKQLCF